MYKRSLKFIIKDWANNILFKEITFSSFEDAWEYIYDKFPEDECFDDYYVEEVTND